MKKGEDPYIPQFPGGRPGRTRTGGEEVAKRGEQKFGVSQDDGRNGDVTH